MQYLFVVVCFLGAIAGMSFVGSLDLGAGFTAVLVVPQILLVIFSMARLKPKGSEIEHPS